MTNIGVSTRSSNLKNQFPAYLPELLYCSDDLKKYGVRLRFKTGGIRRKYIQFNDPWNLQWMLFDLDYQGARLAHEEFNVCPPNIIIENPTNQHAHYAYLMETTIFNGTNSRKTPIEYFNDLRRGMTKRLHADSHFTHFIAKNPLHQDWHVIFLRDRPVSLYEINDWLNPTDKRKVLKERSTLTTSGEEHRYYLFEAIRHKAYKKVISFKRNGNTEEQFIEWNFNQLMEINLQSVEPTPIKKLSRMAERVGSWVWRHFHADDRLSETQRFRAGIRWQDHISVESEKPWEDEGISRRTWFYNKATAKIIIPS